ncbi:hypothetical protein [Pseudarthrobacter sp. PvP090]|uniref:hypothetical protein n=1 Tax=Pseudarthrobacter sp. PvP090 TaxID=3156393 RepID=UPI0033967ABD
MAEQLSDDELSAALAGDPSGFSAVYSVISPAVLGYFRARGVDDAEALTQRPVTPGTPRLPGAGGDRDLPGAPVLPGGLPTIPGQP